MGFRQGRGCMDQVCAVRHVCEKYLANMNDEFCAFMDFEKAYDTIDRHGMWQKLRVYGVGGKLLKAVQSFYVDAEFYAAWCGVSAEHWCCVLWCEFWKMCFVVGGSFCVFQGIEAITRVRCCVTRVGSV